MANINIENLKCLCHNNKLFWSSENFLECCEHSSKEHYSIYFNKTTIIYEEIQYKNLNKIYRMHSDHKLKYSIFYYHDNYFNGFCNSIHLPFIKIYNVTSLKEINNYANKYLVLL